MLNGSMLDARHNISFLSFSNRKHVPSWRYCRLNITYCKFYYFTIELLILSLFRQVVLISLRHSDAPTPPYPESRKMMFGSENAWGRDVLCKLLWFSWYEIEKFKKGCKTCKYCDTYWKKVSTFDKLVWYRSSIGSKESIPQSMKYRYFIFDF